MKYGHTAALPGLASICLFAFTAAAAPIDCTKASVDVEQAICADRGLLAADKAISVRLAALARQCPSQKKLLVQGQKFWLRERWDCRNGEGALEPNGTLAACLESRMGKRLQELEAVAAGCDFSSLTATYRFVDVAYMRQYSSAFVGKTVAVFGSMELDVCRKPGALRTTAIIVDQSHRSFPARFSAMPDREKEFLCAQHPAAHWNGVVKSDKQGAYLYLTDILGQELEQP